MSTGYLSGLVICFVCIITFIPYNTALTTKPVRCPSGGSHSTVPKRSPRLSPTRLLLARSPHSAAEPVSDTRMPPLLLGFFLSLSVYNYSATGLTSVEREAQRSQTRPPVSTARSHRTGCPPQVWDRGVRSTYSAALGVQAVFCSSGHPVAAGSRKQGDAVLKQEGLRSRPSHLLSALARPPTQRASTPHVQQA